MTKDNRFKLSGFLVYTRQLVNALPATSAETERRPVAGKMAEH